MKKFNVTVSRVGFATIEAETQEDAFRIADNLGSDDFEWELGFNVTDCQEEEGK